MAAKITGVVLVCTLLSLVYVFVYEFFTQTSYFAVKKISVTGTQQLNQDEVIRQSRMTSGKNILKVNLSVTRLALLAHPWIESARVAREIPDTIHIQIAEQRPVAMVEFKKRYLINAKGRIFKEWESTDPDDSLPLITGLSLTDISLQGEPSSQLFGAVMEILNLGRNPSTILPNREIKQIHADPEIGLSLVAFEDDKTIRLGYGEFENKYERLSRILTTLERGTIIRDFERIDLNDLNRVIVTPSGEKPQPHSGKEVKLARTG